MDSLSRPCRCIAAILAALLLVAAPRAARAEVLVDLAAGVTHESNLTRAQNAQDRRSDFAFPFSLSASQHLAVSGYAAWTLAAEVRGEAHRRFQDLDRAGFAVRASYRHKFGLGPAAPYALVAASIAYDDYRADVRDGHRIDAHVEAGWRWGDALDVAAGIAVDRRYARVDLPIVPGISGALFDLRGAGAYWRGSYAWNGTWLAMAQLSVRRGDVESTSQRSMQVFLASDAIANDPAFEDPALFGYRLRGTTWSGGVTTSRALSDRASLDFGFLVERTHAARGLRYPGRMLSLTYVHRF